MRPRPATPGLGRRRRLPHWAVAAVTIWLVASLNSPMTAGSAAHVPGGWSTATARVTVAAGVPESATINQGLIGFNHVSPGSGPALSALGTHWTRTDVSFETSVNGRPVYNCTTGAWNPQVLDANVALDRQAGATPELIVDYTPPCLATDPPVGVNPNYTPPDIGPDMAKWQALVYQMALHEIGAEGVRVFEVWNEPNGEFWVATNKVSAYLTLYQATATALEAAATALGVKILVGGPALVSISVLPYQAWIDQLCSLAVTNDLPLDFISWHEYLRHQRVRSRRDSHPGPSGQVPDPASALVDGRVEPGRRCERGPEWQ